MLFLKRSNVTGLFSHIIHFIILHQQLSIPLYFKRFKCFHSFDLFWKHLLKKKEHKINLKLCIMLQCASKEHKPIAKMSNNFRVILNFTVTSLILCYYRDELPISVGVI